MKLFNRRSPVTPGGGTPTDISETSSIAISLESNPNRPSHTPTFDLFVARVSALIEALAYVGAALSTNQSAWIAATLSSSLGGGFAPSVQALVLELHREAETEEVAEAAAVPDLNAPPGGGGAGVDGHVHQQEPSASASSVGRVYGAMSVLQALCSQILGPEIYGWTFFATIQAWPKGIFWLSAGMLGVAFVGMMLIRLVDPRAEDAESGTGEGNDERAPLLVADEETQLGNRYA
jgi:hypothetical protein